MPRDPLVTAAGREEGPGHSALSALLHMLGLDADHRDPSRNHYVTGEGDADMAALLAAGLVEEARAPMFLAGGDRVFRATPKGHSAAVAENRRRNPPPSRMQRRYLAWLRISDVCPDLTFGEFLRRRMYAERAHAHD